MGYRKIKTEVPFGHLNRKYPQVAEEILAAGSADMVSMARPFLADAEIVNKAKEGRR